MLCDSALVSRVAASPNHEERKGGPVDTIILHYTGMESGDAALARLCDPEAKVSSHYLVYEDGCIVQLVAETERAYHAGVSSWRGHADINSRSIGVEIVNGGHDYGCPDFPDVQIRAVVALCRDIAWRWPIDPENVLAHSDIAPARKRDPGEWFPWRTLFESGVGLWVTPAPLSESAILQCGDSGEAVLRLKQSLASYGYGVTPGHLYDGETSDVVAAFQRHFRPQRVDGVADGSTCQTLGRLLQVSQWRGGA